MIRLKPINNLKTLSVLALLFFVFSTSTRADTYKSGIAKTTEGIEIRGSILFHPATPGFVSVMQFNSRVITFTASQLEYFQIDGENPYVSRTIIYRNREQKVFLEKAVSGPLTYLYMENTPDRFFIENHKFAELTAANITEEINTLAPGCERWQPQLGGSRLHHKKMRFIVEEINKENCRNIPFSAGGITTGRVMARHDLGDRAFGEDLPFETDKTQYSFTLGLYLEIPLWKVPFTHLRFQTGFYQHKFSQAFYTDPSQYSVLSINRTDMMTEFLPVFHLNTVSLRPYIFVGPAIILNLSNKSELVKQTASPDGIRTRTNKVYVNTFSPGLTIGAGLKYHYSPQRFIAIEIKNTNIIMGNEHNVSLLQGTISASIVSF